MADPSLRAVPAAVAPAVSESDWQAVRAIRQTVFVEEQACPPDEEWDAPDAPERRGRSTHHLLARVDGQPAGCARWRPVDAAGGLPTAKLERFAVLPAFRGQGIGRALIARAITDASATHPRLVLHAQAHLEGLYAQFGFRSVGAPFWEAGIEHVKMERTAGAS